MWRAAKQGVGPNHFKGCSRRLFGLKIWELCARNVVTVQRAIQELRRLRVWTLDDQVLERVGIRQLRAFGVVLPVIFVLA